MNGRDRPPAPERLARARRTGSRSLGETPPIGVAAAGIPHRIASARASATT